MKFSTAKEVAEALRVSPDTIRRKAKCGIIPCKRVGASYRFEMDRVLNVLEAKKQQSI